MKLYAMLFFFVALSACHPRTEQEKLVLRCERNTSTLTEMDCFDSERRVMMARHYAVFTVSSYTPPEPKNNAQPSP